MLADLRHLIVDLSVIGLLHWYSKALHVLRLKIEVELVVVEVLPVEPYFQTVEPCSAFAGHDNAEVYVNCLRRDIQFDGELSPVVRAVRPLGCHFANCQLPIAHISARRLPTVGPRMCPRFPS